MSSGSMPAVRIARIEATAAMDAVVSCAAATRRSRMPVRDTIHSSFVSTSCSRSLFVRTCAGAYRPQPVTWAFGLRGTRLPLSGSTRTTRPARSDLISLNSFIASIRPMTWPTATSPPTATYGAEPGAGEA